MLPRAVTDEGQESAVQQAAQPAKVSPSVRTAQVTELAETAQREQGSQIGEPSPNREIQSSARESYGDIAPAFVRYSEDVLFGDVWRRGQLSLRDRSLITVAALMAGGMIEQLPYHLRLAVDNGLTIEELTEAITHLAFYAGWPRAASALTVLKEAAGR
ncbi:carboxymuconolactone decarboxylase family protein (plasmid) [Paenibacillus cellulosilyticus]|nr:carboxymuconolactone decarboxylase family protein [Paenibacillus cellulosilyticus]